MRRIKPGDRVVTVVNGQVEKVIVKDVLGDIAIVDFGEGYLGKKFLHDLAIEPTPEPVEPEKPTEPVEKSGITITPRDFENISSFIIDNLLIFIGEEKAELLGRFSAMLSQQMFYNASKND